MNEYLFIIGVIIKFRIILIFRAKISKNSKKCLNTLTFFIIMILNHNKVKQRGDCDDDNGKNLVKKISKGNST